MESPVSKQAVLDLVAEHKERARTVMYLSGYGHEVFSMVPRLSGIDVTAFQVTHFSVFPSANIASMRPQPTA
jgi:hypothetical protein